MPHLYKIPLLKTGKRQDAFGNEADITLDVLKSLRRSYNPDQVYEAQVVIGHDEDLAAIPNNDRAPSFGQLKSVHIKPDPLDEGQYKLEGLVDLVDEADDWVKRRLYNHISLAYYEPDNPYNPSEDEYIRHIALLGAQPPAIKDLGKMVKLKEKNMKMNIRSFQEGEDIEEVVVDAPPVDGPLEDIQAFLKDNAVDFLKSVLTEGEFGFAGEIVAFDPVPSEENNYLMNPETGVFEGKFIDEDEEVFLFEFDGETKSFIPEIQTEEDEELEAEEDELASFSEQDCGRYVYKKGDKVIHLEIAMDDDKTKDLPVEELVSLKEGMDKEEEKEEEETVALEETFSKGSADVRFTGTDEVLAGDAHTLDDPVALTEEPVMEEVVEEEENEEMTILKAKVQALNEELAILREEKALRRLGELEAFAEGLYEEGKLLETEVPKKELVELLSYLDGGTTETKAFKEGDKKPIDMLQSILASAEKKVLMEDVTAMKEGEKVEMPSLQIPEGAVIDPDMSYMHARAKQISKESGKTFLQAYSELIMNQE